ncbi:MAG TPA: serine/threonine-protein kinase [Kofleriaceae bacterium]|nr:serine/threonine-protein kinase [Kofleriaceae bacterium]
MPLGYRLVPASDTTDSPGAAAGGAPALDAGGSAAVCDAMAGARPAVDPIERAVVRSRAASALFGDGAGRPRIGRYVVLERAGAGGMGVVWEAYDPELDRAVAIKLVRADTTRARDRVLAEGQALARLSHPNVVPVFDVGLYGDQVYLVMELVRGDTLRAHVAARRGDARAIAQIYRQAGEGLAAAHRAGIIHRDFKPDNAIVGRDGRVRILDFGVAYTVDPDAAAEAATAAAGGPPAAGTPRYMAPEQASGGAITAAADQFAFCASLREALTEDGARPAAVPRWLEAVVARGTQTDPAARFPSMDEVTRALGRDPRVVLRNRLLAVGAAALVAGAFAIGRAAAEPDDQASACAGGRAAIESVWGARQRRALVDRFGGARDVYARESAPRIADRLDRYRDGWAAGHRDACLAHRRGEQSAALLDRRMACLARGKAALGATVDVLALTPASAIPGALVAVGELPDLDRCGDPAAMLSAVAPPPPAIAGQVAAVDADLERALVLLRGDRTGEARDLAVAAVAASRRLDHAPLLARALLVLGRIEMESTPRSRALAPLGEATALALEVADDALAVEAFARRAWVDGTSAEPDFARALDGLSIIEALSSRLGPAAGFSRALLHNNVAGVEQARGRPDRARVELERALVEARRTSGAGSIEIAKVPAHLALVVDDPVRRDALFAEATGKLTAALGADHPMTLDVRIMAGVLAPDPRESARRLEPACRAYSRLHPSRGAAASQCWFDVGWLAHERGAVADVAAAMSQVVATAGSGGDGGRVGLARAYLALARGDPAAAAAGFVAVRSEAGAIEGQPWWVRWIAAEAELGEGFARRADSRAAEDAFDRARVLFELIAREQPAVYIERRLARARAELAGRRAARRAPPRQVAPLARAAAAWYRAAGGYDAAVAELSALAAPARDSPAP